MSHRLGGQRAGRGSLNHVLREQERLAGANSDGDKVREKERQGERERESEKECKRGTVREREISKRQTDKET